jgi:5,10-methylenetetrahydrofolate reductase/ferredoxin
MIVGEQKPISEIKQIVAPYKKVLLLGCGTCVKTCFAGGDDEVAVLASALRLSCKIEGKEIEIEEQTVERQCEDEFIQESAGAVGRNEAILSLACGAGVQAMARRFASMPVLPGVNTTFMGVLEKPGLFTEECSGCGDCKLAVFGGICPFTRCAKKLVNGPCGGSRNGRCEINSETDCAWHLIIERLKALGQMDNLRIYLPPKNWAASFSSGPRKLIQRGSCAMTTESAGKLQQVLTSGGFAVTAECGPPRGSDPEIIRKKGDLLKGCVDAVNVTDNQTAIVRMSSIAACVHLVAMGIEPVMQMVTRDRNRIALQSDIMGAHSLGIHNILCLSGDHQTFGSQPDALNVFDIDSMNLVRAVLTMREQGQDMSGYELKGAPKMFIGAAANPFADPFEYRVIRLAKKIEAGADFIQTQCVFNMERFKAWMKMAREKG